MEQRGNNRYDKNGISDFTKATLTVIVFNLFEKIDETDSVGKK